jgi:hypothetical protein
MRLFLKYIFVFLIPIFSYFIFFEIYLRGINTTYKIKEKELISNQNKIELLILGNSHSVYGIDPNQFDLIAYNLANVNQSLYFDKRIVLKHIDELTNLRFVIISLDCHSLYFSSQTIIRDTWSYYGHGIEYKNEMPNLSKISYLNGYTNKVAINFLEKDFSKKYNKIKAIDVEEGVDLNEKITKGWFSLNGTNKKIMNEENYQIRANLFNEIIKNSTEKKEILNDLEDFIFQLKARKITPILLTIPCFAPFRKQLNDTLIEQTTKDIINLANKNNIRYWNYFGLPLDETNFYNCDHLNYYGARIFSKTLNTKMKNLNIN